MKGATAELDVQTLLATTVQITNAEQGLHPGRTAADIQKTLTDVATVEHAWQQGLEQGWDPDAKSGIDSFLKIPPGTQEDVTAKAGTIEQHMMAVMAKDYVSLSENDAQLAHDLGLPVPKTKSRREYLADWAPLTDYTVSFYGNAATMPTTAPSPKGGAPATRPS